MSDNLLYYSTNSYLAYYISKKFFDNKHFIWCTPVYDPSKLDDLDLRRKIPNSSNPHKIYLTYLNDVETNDLHSDKIKNNKSGLKKAAVAKLADKSIDNDEFAKINFLIDNASIDYFKPLLYIIPKELIKSKLKVVAVDLAANPLSEEYIVIDLEECEFEVIQTK